MRWCWVFIGVCGIGISGAQPLPSQPEEQLRMAQTLESIGDYAGAARMYEQLFRRFPDSAAYVLGWSRALIKLRRFPEALPEVMRFLQHRSVPELWAVLGTLYWSMGKQDSARWAWQKALAQEPRTPEAYRAVASSQYELQLVEEAIATLLQGRQQLHSDTLFAEELSSWYVRLGEVERGVQETLHLLQQRQDVHAVYARLLVYLALPGAAERIRSELERTLQQYSRDPLVRRLLIWFFQEIGQPQAALEHVRRLDELQGAAGAELLQFADASRQNGELALALQVYGELLQRRPAREIRLKALYGYVQTAETILRQGRQIIPWQQVRREYEELVRQADTLALGAEVLFSLGRFLADVAQDAVAAEESFQRLVRQFPETHWAGHALVELAKLSLRRGDLGQAEQFVQRAAQMDSLAPEAAQWARFWQAEIEFFRGNLDSARAGYAAIALQTASPAANDALERLVLLENIADSERLRQFAAAELLFFQRQWERAQREFLRIAEQTGDEQVVQLSLLRAAKAALAREDLTTAQQLLTRLLAEHEDVLYGDRALLLLGEALERQGRRAEALAVYQQFFLRFPNSIYQEEVRRRIQRLREGAEQRRSTRERRSSASRGALPAVLLKYA